MSRSRPETPTSTELEREVDLLDETAGVCCLAAGWTCPEADRTVSTNGKLGLR
jgi:hypothetical protein